VDESSYTAIVSLRRSGLVEFLEAPFDFLAELIDVGEVADDVPAFVLSGERTEILGRQAVEMQPGNALAIVVVEQDSAVGLRVPHADPLRMPPEQMA
jgi:hypothetical protein